MQQHGIKYFASKPLSWSYCISNQGERSIDLNIDANTLTLHTDFPNTLNSKNLPIFLNWSLSNEKSIFADNSRAEPTIFSRENIILL